jgi:hypothetical protein
MNTYWQVGAYLQIKTKKMRLTIIRFSILFLVLVFVQYACGQAGKESKILAANVNTNSEILRTEDTTFEKLRPRFEAWLKEMPLNKPAKCFLSILDKMPNYLFKPQYIKVEENDTEYMVVIPYLGEKKLFQQFINGFIVLPLHDRYILATTKVDTLFTPYKYYMKVDEFNKKDTFRQEYHNCVSPFAILAVFNRSDSLLDFGKMDCPNNEADYTQVEGSGSIYLQDWDKDGHDELFVKTNTFDWHLSSHSANEARKEYIQVFEIANAKGSIIPIFNRWFDKSFYSGNSSAGETLSNTDWKISFENPSLMKLVEIHTSKMNPAKLDAKDYQDKMNEYDDLVKEQQKWLKKPFIDTIITTFYQQNKKTKQFEEVKN